MDTICGIYRIENLINHKIYIGSSQNIEDRIQKHTYMLDDHNHINKHLQNAFNKYGFDNFVYDILIECDPDKLLYYEQRFMDAWKPDYNISKVAGKPSLTPDIIKKISESMRGKKASPGTRSKMSESQKGNSNCLGHRHTIETRNKISDSLLGNKHSVGRVATAETKQKLSDVLKGRKFSDDTRRKLSESKIGKPRSDETRRKISEGKMGKSVGTGRKLSIETRFKIHKSLLGNKRTLGYEHTEETKRKISESQKKRWTQKKVLSIMEQV